MTTYRLASTGLVHTPGLVAWAINGFAFKRDRANLLAVFAAYDGLPKAAAKALLSEAVPYTVEGDTVVFTYPAPRLTQAKVKAELAARDITFRKTDCGEYRVNLKGAGEGPAYYTTDLEDARDSGLAMADRRDSQFRPSPIRAMAMAADFTTYRYGLANA